MLDRGPTGRMFPKYVFLFFPPPVTPGVKSIEVTAF